MIIISFDVETPSKSIKCELYRIESLIEILKKYDAKATLFLSIFEKNRFRFKFEKIIPLLQHYDVQLHVHPEHCGFRGPSRLSRYSFEQQFAIIAEAKRIFCEYFPPPIAFRAGGYGANLQTLKALIGNNIYIDSSFWKSKNIPGIFELPIQTFYRRKFGLKLRRKVDIDWTKLSELKEIYARKKYLHITGHSYSDPGKLEKFLKTIDVSDIITFSDIADGKYYQKNIKTQMDKTADRKGSPFTFHVSGKFDSF